MDRRDNGRLSRVGVISLGAREKFCATVKNISPDTFEDLHFFALLILFNYCSEIHRARAFNAVNRRLVYPR